MQSLKELTEYINPLYEDNHLIVAVKPPNIPTQKDKSGDISFFEYVKDYIKLKYNKSGNIFLGLVHRLDRPVSGIMVFAKTSKAAGRLSESIRERKFEKIYYAVVNGIFLDKTGILENYIIKKSNKLGNIAQIVFENTKNSKFAKLSEKYCGVKYLKNRVRDPRAFVDESRVQSFQKEIEKFAIGKDSEAAELLGLINSAELLSKMFEIILRRSIYEYLAVVKYNKSIDKYDLTHDEINDKIKYIEEKWVNNV